VALRQRFESFLAARDGDDGHAARGKTPRNGLADPARRTGDDRDPSMR
jgi:hypothetical protein